MMIFILIVVVISYALFLSLAKASSKDNYKDFEEIKDDSNNS